MNLRQQPVHKVLGVHGQRVLLPHQHAHQRHIAHHIHEVHRVSAAAIAAEHLAALFFHLRVEGPEDGFPPRVSHPLADGGFPVENAGQVQGRFERHRQGVANIGGRGRDQDVEIPILGDPLLVCRMIVGKGPEVQLDGDRLGLTRLERHLCETFQLLFGPHQTRCAVVDVHLDDFLARHVARVGDIHRDGQPVYIPEGLAPTPWHCCRRRWCSSSRSRRGRAPAAPWRRNSGSR